MARAAAKEPGLDREQARELLSVMWRIRVFEERVARLKRSLQVHGLIHLSIGGEAVAAAVCGQLRDDDALYSGHRAHGHAIAKGVPLGPIMAELMGRHDGLCRGLGGSMHLVDREHGLCGATGVVGGNIPLAAGDALAASLSESDRVTVVFFGDGAVQAGHFHESVNLAALWQLPLIFVCENNGFAEFTTRAEHSPVERVSDVVAPYGFDTATVDGSDTEAVWTAFGKFLREARTGSGPFLLECLTHRRRGHYEGDAQEYRDPDAECEWELRDPLMRFQSTALAAGWIGQDGTAALAAAAEAAVDAAVEFARASPFPTTERAAELVYAPAPS
ncbi:MAG TPA: thiamine pyrophosphate-dependent dehydrogenase E1 component subunit alpha [Solirubrobacteraceae bacterium]|nr:thiamine pyrophosphate-dependent dehydrogenase E1 component subunit alpha [Solirubrobacteraceae bacterium]